MRATNLGFYNTSGTRTHVRFQFSTHASAGGNVAPASAFEAADLRIYKAADGAAFSATQRSSANGITMTSPFDSLTGFHDVDIDLTDNTDASFYASGGFYSIVLAPDSETVDGQTITALVLAYFEVGPQPVDVNTIKGQTVTAAAGVTFPTSIASPTNITAGTITTVTNLTNAPTAGDLTATMKTSVTTAATAATPVAASVTGNVGGNVVGSVASVTADVGITQAAADKVWGTTSRTLSSFGTLVADVATAVWGAATRLLTAGTNIVLAKGTGVTGFNDLSAAQVNAEVDTAIADAALATAANLATVDTVADAIQAKTDNLPSDPADQSLIIAATNAIIEDTEDIQSRLPAALVNGNLKVDVIRVNGVALTGDGSGTPIGAA